MEKGLQYRRTDRAIMNALIKLVNQGSFEKLTVQEILDEALVCRNTFYAHYRDKYDIAEQLFKKYKEDFLKLLKESYTDIGKEWAGTSQFQEFSDLPARLFFQFYQEHKDLIYALNKIKTDKVDMDQFVSQLFRERYLCAPSNQTRQNPERNLELEAEIYASVYNAIAHYYSFSGSNVTLPIPHMEEALCHVFLYSIGIIEKHCEEDAFSYVMDTAKQAKERKENYQ